jgi:hypothetical protein
VMDKHTRTRLTNQVRTAFERFCDLNFPLDSSDDVEASVLHDELVDFNMCMAGRLSSLLGDGRPPASDLKADDELRRRLEELVASNSSGASDAKRYLDYLGELESVLAMARGLAR